MDCIWMIPGVHTQYRESSRSLAGVQQEGPRTIRTTDGLHQDAWGSVTYRQKVWKVKDQIASSPEGTASFHSIGSAVQQTRILPPISFEDEPGDKRSARVDSERNKT